jgi:hypothetical protein
MSNETNKVAFIKGCGTPSFEGSVMFRSKTARQPKHKVSFVTLAVEHSRGIGVNPSPLARKKNDDYI